MSYFHYCSTPPPPSEYKLRVGPLSVVFLTIIMESLWTGLVSHGRRSGAVLGVFAGLS